MQLKTRSKKQGFSLIEVLVAMAILTFAMLGIASLHLVSLENNHAAQLRSQSVAISGDLVERIRNNPALRQYVMENNLDSASDFSQSSGETNLAAACTSASGCSEDVLVRAELEDWAKTLKRLGDTTKTSLTSTPPVNVTLDYDSTKNLFDLSVTWQTKQWKLASAGATTQQSGALRNRAQSSYQFSLAIN